jgi:hypothetical protein
VNRTATEVLVPAGIPNWYPFWLQTTGGLGGFVLANVLGSMRQLTASHGAGFVVFGLVSAVGAGAIFFVGRTWESTFLGKGGVVAVPQAPGAVGAPAASVELTWV